MANQVVAKATAAAGFLPRPSPKRTARWPPPTPGLECPFGLSALHHAAVDGGHPTTPSPTRRILARGGKRWMMRAQPGEAPDTRLARTGATAKQASDPFQ